MDKILDYDGKDILPDNLALPNCQQQLWDWLNNVSMCVCCFMCWHVKFYNI